MCEITDNAVKELQAENVLAKELDHGGFKKKKKKKCHKKQRISQLKNKIKIKIAH